MSFISLLEPFMILLGVRNLVRSGERLVSPRRALNMPIAPPMPPPYGPFWRARRFAWLGVAVTASLGPWMIWQASSAHAPFNRWGGWAALSATVLILRRLTYFPCPRCGRPFTCVQGRHFDFHHVFTTRCLQCSLKAGSPGP